MRRGRPLENGMKPDPEAVPMSLQWLVAYHAPLRGYEFGECVHVLRTMVGSASRGNRCRIVKERWAWRYCVPLRFANDADYMPLLQLLCQQQPHHHHYHHHHHTHNRIVFAARITLHGDTEPKIPRLT